MILTHIDQSWDTAISTGGRTSARVDADWPPRRQRKVPRRAQQAAADAVRPRWHAGRPRAPVPRSASPLASSPRPRWTSCVPWPGRPCRRGSGWHWAWPALRSDPEMRRAPCPTALPAHVRTAPSGGCRYRHRRSPAGSATRVGDGDLGPQKVRRTLNSGRYHSRLTNRETAAQVSFSTMSMIGNRPRQVVQGQPRGAQQLRQGRAGRSRYRF